MSKVMKFWIFIKGMALRFTDDKIGIYSAQASFFFVLSIFPLIMLIFATIGLTNIPQDTIFRVVKEIVPDNLGDFVNDIINDIYKNSSGILLSLTGLAALWSASKGVFALTNGMNNIYKAKINRPYIVSRFLAIIYTFLFIVVVVFTLGLLVFGNKIYAFITLKAPLINQVLSPFIGNRTLITLLILTLFFLAIYKTVPKSEYSLVDLLPGALFSSVGWIIFSYIFSIYVDNSVNYSNMYGSLTTIIFLMLWIYFCMGILFVGAELNVAIRYDLRRIIHLHQYKAAIRHERKKE